MYGTLQHMASTFYVRELMLCLASYSAKVLGGGRTFYVHELMLRLPSSSTNIGGSVPSVSMSLCFVILVLCENVGGLYLPCP